MRFARIALLPFAAILLALALFEHYYDSTGPHLEERTVFVPRGSGLTATARILLDAGVIRDDWSFAFGAWLRGAADDLRAGEYRIAAGASMAEVLRRIRGGHSVQRQFTVPEGARMASVMARIAENPYLSGDLPEALPEGLVAPETYFFVRGDSRAALYGRMASLQTAILETLWEERAPDLPFDTPEEALVLASIVERETGLAEERPRVAAVFVNRLRRGMRLQSDPTVLYAIESAQGPLGRPLTRADLAFSSPYNTYQNGGLPPGPIANPGRAAIVAALRPDDTDEYYFVADGSGGHAFARTLDEHNRNVARWRRLRQRDGGGE